VISARTGTLVLLLILAWVSTTGCGARDLARSESPRTTLGTSQQDVDGDGLSDVVVDGPPDRPDEDGELSPSIAPPHLTQSALSRRTDSKR
jgi:hypothetical protein